MRAKVRCGENSRSSAGTPREAQAFLGLACQAGQCRTTVHASPKYARRSLVGEPSQLPYFNFERRPGSYLGQRLIQFIDARFRPCANELGCDVQVIERAPVDQCFGAKRGNQTLQPEEDALGQIDGGEESHDGRGNVLA